MQQDRPAAEEAFTIAEVAGFLRVSEKTIKREINAGRLAHIQIRRSIRITSAQYARYVRDLTRK